jgi:hypothetical protein
MKSKRRSASRWLAGAVFFGSWLGVFIVAAGATPPLSTAASVRGIGVSASREAQLMTLIGIDGGTTSTVTSTAARPGGLPPAFPINTRRAVPIDIERVDISYEFDVTRREVRANAVMRFRVHEVGLPYFDLVPAVTSLRLDSEVLTPGQLTTHNDPDNVTQLRVLQRSIDDLQPHTLTMTYLLAAADVTFLTNSVRFASHMDDLAQGGRKFFEQFGPANLEFDQLEYHIQLAVTGTSVEHEVFANGRVERTAMNRWTIDFPSYFTSSSPFLHVCERDHVQVVRAEFRGRERAIPVVAYAAQQAAAQEASRVALRTLAENEEAYGAYCHSQCLIYICDIGGGMEYCGATATSLSALEHEVTHSWFARGVMPADGNSGWIDEAVASWRDNRYPRARGAPSGNAVNLSGFPPHRRETPTEAYTSGARLLSQLDYMSRAENGLRPVLSRLYQTYKRRTITVQGFQDFLQDAMGQDLGGIFERHVFGITPVSFVPDPTTEPSSEPPDEHPRPFTAEERVQNR